MRVAPGWAWEGVDFRKQLDFLATIDSSRGDRNMTRNRSLLVLTGLIGGLLLFLRAPDGKAKIEQESTAGGGPAVPKVADGDAPKQGASLEVALLRPYRFPFAKPTPLFEVCAHLKQTLKSEVVLDLAALGRQDVEPEDRVQLDLEGVRLKTGLKLLLDQVGLTYRIVAEDNLMIITDLEGSDDPMSRVLSELQCAASRFARSSR